MSQGREAMSQASNPENMMKAMNAANTAQNKLNQMTATAEEDERPLDNQ